LEHLGRDDIGNCILPARIFQDQGADLREIDSQFLELRLEKENLRTMQKSWATAGYADDWQGNPGGSEEERSLPTKPDWPGVNSRVQ